MAAYKLFCLGSPSLALGDQPVKLEMRKALALLVYLRLVGRSCSREVLAATFWPEHDQQHAHANLRRVLSSLRASLGADILEADREQVGINESAQIWSDVEVFHQLLAKAKNHSHHAGEICPDCLANQEEAIQLYRGDFLEGFNLEDCTEFDEWQYLQRENLRQKFAQLLENVAAAYSAQRQWEIALDYALCWVGLDRLNEPAQRSLIQLYALAGNRSAARRQYEEFSSLLKKELDQTPERETVELYKNICENTPGSQSLGPRPAIQISTSQRTFEPVLKTKLKIPTLSGEKILRKRLLDELDQIDEYALTILSAPAGFGKTTVLTQWITQNPLPVGWVSLDNHDNDPVRFLTYVIAAIESIHAKLGINVHKLLDSAQSMPLQSLITTLLHSLEPVTQTFILVLEDYHSIEANSVHEMVSFILDHQPAGMHLLISTRADPPLALARLRSRQQLLEIRGDDLRFSLEETSAYLNQVMNLNLPTNDVETLERRTEGWIVGLQMAALALKARIAQHGQQDLSAAIQEFSGSHRYILDYLVEEVLGNQPDRIQAFLLRTSILTRLCSSLCDSVTGIQEWDIENVPIRVAEITLNSSQQILEYLDRANLFIIPLDDDRRWYRYHSLFTELLRARLRGYGRDLMIDLHTRAAGWYEAHGFSVEAVEHALASQDKMRASMFIEEVAEKVIRNGGFSTVLEWMKNLPEDLIQTRPWLCIWYSWALLQSGTLEGVEELIYSAEIALQNNTYSDSKIKANETQEIQEQLVTLHATVASLRDDHEHTIELCVKALAHIRKENNWQRINLLYVLGNAYYLLGELSQAEHYYQQVQAIAERIEFFIRYVLSTYRLAHIQQVRGNLRQAYDLYQSGLRTASAQRKETSLGMGLIYAGLGEVLYEWNRLDEAKEMILEGVRVDELTKIPTILANSYNLYARLLIQQGDLETARDMLTKVKDMRRIHPIFLESAEANEACWVRLWLAIGDLTTASIWAQEHQLASNHTPGYCQVLSEIAYARVLIAQGQLQAAGNCLAEIATAAQTGGWIGRLIEIRMLQALAAQPCDQQVAALDYMESSLLLAEPQGYMRLFLEEGSHLSSLLRDGLKGRIWKDPRVLSYAQKLSGAM